MKRLFLLRIITEDFKGKDSCLVKVMKCNDFYKKVITFQLLFTYQKLSEEEDEKAKL